MNNSLFLIFHGRYPSEKAASLFAAKSAEAFAALGMRVTLVVPRRFRTLRVNDQAYYEVKHPFHVVYLPTIDLFPLRILERVVFRISLIFFSFAAWIYLRLHASRGDIVYSNESLPIVFASFVVKTTVYEIHDYPDGFKPYYEFLFDRVRHIVVTNKHKLERIGKEFPHAIPQAFYEPNAVAVDAYVAAPDRHISREQLGLPSGAKIIVYTGHLYSWKGVDMLGQVARELPGEVYVVGGTKKDVAAFKKKWGSIPNLHVVGHRPHDEMPLWQIAADVLVLPNTGKEDISVEYTSPMKLFEYMASGTPIVASDLLSIREIALGKAVLVRPDDPAALKRGIVYVLEGGGQSESVQAFQWVREHTWDARAARIVKELR